MLVHACYHKFSALMLYFVFHIYNTECVCTVFHLVELLHCCY